ncbi:hypothetical protein [Maribacter aurantiacus]|uniref:Lipocalin-like domain-containing protein n=1 Tax=Maribacter aurantiacus TaxID=1882343 RepID=A0A5R8M567_9FLAO|nr:hypothetical protein [Maribacter aurantiacus]TLF44696.1 hypothetical protein FEK29_10680 [Maribacter aurantiacus]
MKKYLIFIFAILINGCSKDSNQLGLYNFESIIGKWYLASSYQTSDSKGKKNITQLGILRYCPSGSTHIYDYTENGEQGFFIGWMPGECEFDSDSKSLVAKVEVDNREINFQSITNQYFAPQNTYLTSQYIISISDTEMILRYPREGTNLYIFAIWEKVD